MDPQAVGPPPDPASATQTHAIPMEGMDHPQDLPEHSSKSGGHLAPAIGLQDLHGGNYVPRYQDGQTGLRGCAPILPGEKTPKRKWWKDWKFPLVMGLVLIVLRATVEFVSPVTSEFEAARGTGMGMGMGRVMKSDDYEHPLLEGRNGAVTSDVEECSVIGINLLRDGGSAVDAAIGTTICTGTINMAASGIGGGGFAIVHLANGTSRSFNFREMAPQASHPDMFVDNPELAKFGGLAFAIPGEVHGFWTLHQKYGKLPWKKLWTPTIELTMHGFPVSWYMAKMIHMFKEHFEQNREEWAFLFSKETGELLVEGEILTRPQFTETLIALSQDDGFHTFYKGYIAEHLVSAAQHRGGIITMDDFSSFFTEETDPVTTQAFNARFITCPAPSSGPALILALNIADGLDLREYSHPVTIHRMMETMKWLSAGRTNLGDPNDDVFNHARVNEIMSTSYAAAARKNISDDTTYPTAHYNPSYANSESKGTSHISVLDKAGNAVAFTTSINLDFGNLMHDTHTGIILNSEMDDFAIPGRPNSEGLYPSIYNFAKPLKRPLSSCVPTMSIELDGLPGMIVGASGGSQILTGVFESIVKNYRWGFDLRDVVRTPRIHHQLIPDVAYVENKISTRIAEGLRRRHHDVKVIEPMKSAVGAITRTEDGKIFAVADWWRKGGHAAVY